MTINVTTDTSVLVKGLVPPRRKAKDQLYSEQLDLHLRSTEILNKVERGEYSNHVPLVTLIEIASVVSRLTNDPKSVSLALSYVSENSKLYLLLTDDRKMYERAALYGLEVNFLRA